MRTSKRVLVITYEFPPIIGGAGVYAHDLSIGLAKCGLQVDVATYSNGRDTHVLASELKARYGITLYSFSPLKFFHFIQFAALVKKLVKNTDYDVIILSDARAKSTFALFSKYLFNNETTKSVSIFHGNEVNSFFEHPSLLLRILRIRPKLQALFHKQKCLITVSVSEQKLWQDFLPDLQEKILLVRHGVNEEVFYKRTLEEVGELKEELKIPSGKRIILSTSRLVQMKGQDNLLAAFSKIVAQRSDVYLLIVGNGTYKNKLQVLCRSLDIEEYVEFRDAVERRVLSKYYSVADVFILISRFTEAFGLVYIEAAACGVPAISGNLGGVTDAVVNHHTGLVVDSFNVSELQKNIEYLLDNERERANLGQNAEVRFRRDFTSEVMARNLIESIQSLACAS